MRKQLKHDLPDWLIVQCYFKVYQRILRHRCNPRQIPRAISPEYQQLQHEEDTDAQLQVYGSTTSRIRKPQHGVVIRSW